MSDVEKRWVRGDVRSARRKYQKPFDECPHCEKYRYTKHKIIGGLLISDEEWMECKNCGYSPDHPNNE